LSKIEAFAVQEWRIATPDFALQEEGAGQIQGNVIMAWSPFISFPLQLQNNPMLSCACLSFVTSELPGW
jgi:hypothetical protein